jgi:hypothetical protein
VVSGDGSGDVSPSLKEHFVSRVVSADFSAGRRLVFGCKGRPSTRCRMRGAFSRLVVFDRSLQSCSCTNVFNLLSCYDLPSRGHFGRSCLFATVPQPVPSWTPADRKSRPRSGAIRPTPIKSIRSSCGTPCRSIIRETPGQLDQVKGKLRAGLEPQGFSRQGGESTPSQKSICFLPCCYLQRYT